MFCIDIVIFIFKLLFMSSLKLYCKYLSTCYCFLIRVTLLYSITLYITKRYFFLRELFDNHYFHNI